MNYEEIVRRQRAELARMAADLNDADEPGAALLAQQALVAVRQFEGRLDELGYGACELSEPAAARGPGPE